MSSMPVGSVAPLLTLPGPVFLRLRCLYRNVTIHNSFSTNLKVNYQTRAETLRSATTTANMTIMNKFSFARSPQGSKLASKSVHPVSISFQNQVRCTTASFAAFQTMKSACERPGSSHEEELVLMARCLAVRSASSVTESSQCERTSKRYNNCSPQQRSPQSTVQNALLRKGNLHSSR